MREILYPPKNCNTRLAGAGFLKGTKTRTLTRTPPAYPPHIPWGYPPTPGETLGSSVPVSVQGSSSAPPYKSFCFQRLLQLWKHVTRLGRRNPAQQKMDITGYIESGGALIDFDYSREVDKESSKTSGTFDI